MRYTSDANSTEYDEKSKKRQEETQDKQERLEKSYKKYLQNRDVKMVYKNNEIQLLGFEVGKIANTKRIYGIDYQMGYNYNLTSLAKN